MKKIMFLFMFSGLFISGVFGQGYSDINAYIKKVDDNGYIEKQKSDIIKIATITNSSRSTYARNLSINAYEVKELYTRAYHETLAYESKIKNNKKYVEIVSQLKPLKKSLKLLIRYSDAIKIYAERIASNYKSSNNRDYFYKIQTAFNSLIKTKKMVKERLIKIAGMEAKLSYKE